MNSKTIIPAHVAYPHTFISKQVYSCLRSPTNPTGKWLVDEDESDQILNEQLKDFVDNTGCAVTQISSPSVSVYEESEGRRVYVTSVSLLYIPEEEGSHDRDRSVDAKPPDTDPE